MVITFHFRPEPCDKLWAKLASVTCSCNENGSCKFLMNCTEEHSTQNRAGTHTHQQKEETNIYENYIPKRTFMWNEKYRYSKSFHEPNSYGQNMSTSRLKLGFPMTNSFLQQYFRKC